MKALAYACMVRVWWMLLSVAAVPGNAPAQAGTAESSPQEDTTRDASSPEDPQVAAAESGTPAGADDRAGSDPASAAELLPTIPLATREPDPLPEEESAPQRSSGIEEIVVTATKRAENIREIPASIVALRGADLEQKGYQGQEDFLKLVPAVTFMNDGVNANRITMRGIGADLNTSNTVGVFLGDVPFDDPILPRVTLDPNPFDLARVEVLKGPQGTLFGGSALNGAVRYVPQDPKLETWEMKGFGQTESVQGGDLGQVYGGAVNVPIGETLAFRFVAFDRTAPGWVDSTNPNYTQQDVNQTDQWGARGMALWQATDALRITLMGVVQDTRIRDSGITDNTEGRLSRSTTPQASPVDTQYDVGSLGIGYAFETFDVLSQSTRAYKTFAGFTDISRIGNLSDTPPPSATILSNNRSESLMQELRFTSNELFSEQWKWLGGLFYRRHRLNEQLDVLASNMGLPLPPELIVGIAGAIPGITGFITEEGQPSLARSVADPITVTELAFFGETTATFFQDLEVTLGLRAFKAKSESRVVFSGALAVNQTLPDGETQEVKEGALVEEAINPKLAIKYRVNDNISAYGAVTRGFRFGGAQVLIGTITSEAPDQYKSDTLWAYEIGLRTQWLEDSLYVDVTPFWTEWKDPQLQQADSTGLGSFFDNVGGARSRGVELAVQYATPLPGLSLALSGSYVDTVTTKPFVTSGGTQTEPGTQWPLAAKWQSTSTLAYRNTLFGNWTGGGSATYTTISKAPNTLDFRDTVFGYESLELALTLGNAEIAGMPELSITLNNALDERGVVSGVNNPQFASDRSYIRPRTLVARLSISF